MKVDAFEGRVTFDVRHVSALGWIEAEVIETELKDAEAPHLERFSYLLSAFSQVMVATDAIAFDFQGDETDLLKEFKAFWETRESKSNEQLWLAYLGLGNVIYGAWNDALLTASRPFAKPEHLPYGALKPSQQAELDNPESDIKKKDSPSK